VLVWVRGILPLTGRINEGIWNLRCSVKEVVGTFICSRVYLSNSVCFLADADSESTFFHVITPAKAYAREKMRDFCNKRLHVRDFHCNVPIMAILHLTDVFYSCWYLLI
jgi:hypothetical protein